LYTVFIFIFILNINYTIFWLHLMPWSRAHPHLLRITSFLLFLTNVHNSKNRGPFYRTKFCRISTLIKKSYCINGILCSKKNSESICICIFCLLIHYNSNVN
jgi:hypothetical protein